MSKRVPFNTTAEAAADPMSFLVAASVLGGGGAIEAQEAAGQQSFVGSDTLPAQMRPEDAAALEAFGVKLGPVVENDPLFRFAVLPPGWRKLATEHSMWSDLVDERGRKRAGIFYKAAFYDRGAHLSVMPRFMIARDYSDRADEAGEIIMLVKDCDAVVFTSTVRRHPKGKSTRDWTREDWDGFEQLESEAQAECVAWLTASGHGDYRSLTAYWSEP